MRAFTLERQQGRRLQRAALQAAASVVPTLMGFLLPPRHRRRV